MAVLSFILSFILKQLGNILQLVFGWSITALFGKLSGAKAQLVTAALAMSVVWPFFVVGLAVPGFAGWAIALLPLQKWVGAGVLRIVWATLGVVTPALVGLVVHTAAPTNRGNPLTSIFRGYPMTLGFFVAFLVVAITVPIVKVASIVRGWSDEHVYVEPRPGEYETVLRDLAEACARAGLMPEITDVPRQMALATAVMQKMSRGLVARIVTDQLRQIRAKDVVLVLYPADLLLRGEPKAIAKVHAMMTRTQLDAHAYVVASPAAQHVQDELARLWQVVADHEKRHETMSSVMASRVRDVFQELAHTDVTYQEWIVLESLVRRLERALLRDGRVAAPRLDEEGDRLGDIADQANKGDAVVRRKEDVKMEPAMPSGPHDKLDEMPVGELLQQTFAEAKELLRTEIDLAKNEAITEVKGAARGGFAFAAGLLAAMLMFNSLILALVLALGGAAWIALLVAGVFMLLAGGSVAAGYAWLPKKMFEATRRRLSNDMDRLKEHAI